MMKRSRGSGESGSCRHHPGKSSRRVLKMLGEFHFSVILVSFTSVCLIWHFLSDR